MRSATSHKECTDSLRTVALVRGDRDQIRLHIGNGTRLIRQCLHGVTVKDDLARLAQGADLPHRLQCADFVVGCDDGHQHGVRCDGRLEIFESQKALLVDSEVCHTTTVLFKRVTRVKNRLVLRPHRDHVRRFRTTPRSDNLGEPSLDGEIDGFRRSRRENDLGRLAGQEFRDLPSRVLDKFLSALTESMLPTRRIAKVRLEGGKQAFNDSRIAGSRRVVIEIDGTV